MADERKIYESDYDYCALCKTRQPVKNMMRTKSGVYRCEDDRLQWCDARRLELGQNPKGNDDE